MKPKARTTPRLKICTSKKLDKAVEGLCFGSGDAFWDLVESIGYSEESASIVRESLRIANESLKTGKPIYATTVDGFEFIFVEKLGYMLDKCKKAKDKMNSKEILEAAETRQLDEDARQKKDKAEYKRLKKLFDPNRK